MDHQHPPDPRGPGATDQVSAAGRCPFSIDRPVMRQRWARLTFLHWAFEATAVQRLLPGGLAVEEFDGAAWVGLVPFFMTVRTAGGRFLPTVGTAGGRQLPWVSRFCETNVRTYVRDERGRPGIWFFSLDAARLGAVAVARATYRLPYFWSAMAISGGGSGGGSNGEITYRCRRRFPGPGGVTSLVQVSVGDPYLAGELTERDHFLTARWILFTSAGSWGSTIRASRASGTGPRRRRLARACHDPWPLYRARALAVDDRLVMAAGLPPPAGEPLVHYSPGVDVAIGRPEPG